MYRFEPLEPAPQAVRRLTCGVLDAALEWLGGADRALDLRVHETRKLLKRLRALLELGASVIEPAALREEEQAAREAARSLADVRGQAALLGCLGDLVERSPGLLADDALAHVRATLGAETQRTSEARPALEQASAILTRARALAQNLPLLAEVHGWAALAPGFRASYRRARRAFDRASSHPSAERLHAFRTPAKRHLYQVELLERAWEGPLRAQRQELAELGELLGDHHDLSLLREALSGRAELAAERAALEAAMDARLRKLERSALGLSGHCFAERPGAITRRFGAYFRESLE